MDLFLVGNLVQGEVPDGMSADGEEEGRAVDGILTERANDGSTDGETAFDGAGVYEYVGGGRAAQDVVDAGGVDGGEGEGAVGCDE
ncbi:MAG: hypothetical protein WC728_15590 [Elusimicrobiota bacterium]